MANALPESLGLSPTEERNPRSTNLDTLPLKDAVALFLSEESTVPRRLLKEQANIAHVVELISAAFQKGGRLFYVGAGTSGRLGVLDASECPPTFRTPSRQVQGIIAGGDAALRRAVEGAEDDFSAGGRAIRQRRITARDVVIGIAASGGTPFVWGSLAEARKRRARTVLLTFNPHLRMSRLIRPTVVIAADLGPELLTGSTRLKAGSATKLLLNMFTTLAMVRCGKTISNLMVDLNPSNTKLKQRAVRIVQQLWKVSAEEAHAALVRSDWVVKKAAQNLSPRRKNRVQ
jgi:N-acetylmuramic acid 6-phosphate etherase